MSGDVLKIRDLSAGYGRRVVLENISMTLAPGDWYVLLGPNGCGKSTLLDCVASRLVAGGGEICIAGFSLAENPYEAKLRLGYACAPDALPPLLTARQCLEVHAGAKGLSAIAEDIFLLAEELNFTPYLESFVDTLSLGTRQKLAVLLALVGDPLLIVLDEAFNGLDPASALGLEAPPPCPTQSTRRGHPACNAFSRYCRALRGSRRRADRWPAEERVAAGRNPPIARKPW